MPETEKPAPTVVPEYGLKLSAALRAVIANKPPEGITLGYIITETGERAFGVLMAFLCLPFLLPLLPGVSVPFGLALLMLGVQLAVGWHRPWLPRRMHNIKLPEKVTAKILSGVATLFKPLERICRPRLKFMQNRASYVAVGLALALQGIMLALPIPIPGTNSIPAWMALILILGITEEDGVTMIVGLLLTAAAVASLVILMVFGWDWISDRYHGDRGTSPPAATAPAAAPASTSPSTLPATAPAVPRG